MRKFTDFLRGRGRVGQSDSAALRVSGDRNHPLVSALLDLYVKQPDTVRGLIEVIPADGEELHISETWLRRPGYRKMIDGISQLLQNSGHEDASKFLDCYFEL